MFGRNTFPATTTFMVLFIALAFVGVGYGLWSKVLYIDTTVQTGEVDAEFEVAFTDDDGVWNRSGIDNFDTDDCGIGSGSCDPEEPGPLPERYEKGVGACTATINQVDNQILDVVINNAYPSYWCTVWFDVENTGSVPVKVQAYNLTGVPDVLEIVPTGIDVDEQIEPGAGKEGGLSIHVLQEADENDTYSFTAAITLVQWNEYRDEGAMALCEKVEGPWTCVPGGATGVLYFKTSDPLFDYDFNAEGLDPSTNYTLIYYPEPQLAWPHPITIIDSGASDADGDLHLVGSFNFGFDLDDAKIWLVLSSDIVGGSMSGWNPTEYLFEQTLIDYTDTS